jgi:hypothetical protein
VNWLERFWAKRGLGACICEGQEISAACAEIERLRAALRALAQVPAVLQVLGRDHTEDCRCPLCNAHALLSPNEPAQPRSGPETNDGQ